VVLLLVLYGAYQLAASADRMLNEPVTAPPPQQMMPRPAVVARQKPAPADSFVGQQQPATPPADAAAPLAQTSAPTPGTALDTSQLQSSGVSEPLPRGQVYGVQNSNARVVLRMRQAARILVEGPDGTLFINRTLRPGDTYQVPNVVGATLTTSNAGAVELDLDGTAVGLVGKNDETAEALSLDPQAIMDRHNDGRFGR
jgi:cytoskeleton protein RodZ